MTTIRNNISTQIDTYGQLEAELKELYALLGKHPIDDKYLKNVLLKALKKYPAQEKMLLIFLDFLQLANSKTIFNQYELKDIDNLFQCVCKYNPYSYEIHVEYYHFLNNVLDKGIQARRVLTSYLKRTNAQLKKLEKLLNKAAD